MDPRSTEADEVSGTYATFVVAAEEGAVPARAGARVPAVLLLACLVAGAVVSFGQGELRATAAASVLASASQSATSHEHDDHASTATPPPSTTTDVRHGDEGDHEVVTPAFHVGGTARHAAHPPSHQFEITAYGKTMRIVVNRNDALFAPQYRETTRLVDGSIVERPGAEDASHNHCHYVGHVVGDEDSSVAVSTCNGGIGGRIKGHGLLLEIRPAQERLRRRLEAARPALCAPPRPRHRRTACRRGAARPHRAPPPSTQPAVARSPRPAR